MVCELLSLPARIFHSFANSKLFFFPHFSLGKLALHSHIKCKCSLSCEPKSHKFSTSLSGAPVARCTVCFSSPAPNCHFLPFELKLHRCCHCWTIIHPAKNPSGLQRTSRVHLDRFRLATEGEKKWKLELISRCDSNELSARLPRLFGIGIIYEITIWKRVNA